jgi:hypothetical protein
MSNGCRQVEQPRGDHAAAPPYLLDLGEVEAAMIPYSMPLWTILTKWPAPLGPQCR